MPIQKNDSDAPDEPMAMRSPDELPPPGDDDPPQFGVRIFSVSPIAGALAGGIPVTITGTGFQPEAEVFFGSNQATGVVVESGTSVQATLPPAAEVGSVNVSLVNPDGTGATRVGGFTYVVTGTGARAEVVGVTPLSVIEDTESEVTLRGRNLIEAHTNGMLALRGPGRVQVTSSLLTSGRDEATRIEELTFTVRIVATPPLEQHERIAIQILASVRPGSLNDGIPESSRKFFTVLPRAVPVPIAFTDNLEPGKSNLVVVAGRNLEGSTLSVGEGATLHVQRSDEQTLVGLVTVSDGLVSDRFVSNSLVSDDATSEGSKSAPTVQLSIHKDGGEVARFNVTVAPNGGSFKESAAMSAEADEGTASAAAAEPGADDIGLTLTSIPGQQIVGPTAEDSSIFQLGGGALTNFGFDFGPFAWRVFSRSFVFSLFNEVRLIPFFDNGVGDALSKTPVVAQVGKLFRLRGMGLMVVLRVELVITIEVVVIIGFRFNIWDFGLFNEFYDDYPFGIGSFVITFRLVILIGVNFNISFMVALVRPGGRLRVLFFTELSIRFRFTIGTDGRTLHFDPDFDIDVDYTRVGPRRNNLRPCGGRFQLADDNGQTEFTNALGDHHSFYFVHEPGECCLPWDFDLRLVRFRPGSNLREVVQESFRADFCLNAAPSPIQNEVVVVSNKTPQGHPPPLELEVASTASLRAMFRQRDEVGKIIPGELRDVTEFGYQVEFYIEPTAPNLLAPEPLRQGTAIAQEEGRNNIHARLFKADVVFRDPTTGEEYPDALWPGSILGFDILGLLARGLPPASRAGTLPVEVSALPQGAFTVVATVAYKDEQNQWRESDEIPNVLPGEVTRELERAEPFEPQPNKPQREYVLAVKLSDVPPDVSPSQPLTLTFTVGAVKLEVVPVSTHRPTALAPLKDIPPRDLSTLQFETDRTKPDINRFFTGSLIESNRQGRVTLDRVPGPDELFVVMDSSAPATPLSVIPNNKEDATASPPKLVPPGVKVADRHVLLSVELTATPSRGNVRRIRTLRLAVSNDETFEEYLRVFKEVQKILTDAGATFSDFAKNFYNALTPTFSVLTAGGSVLTAQGQTLWEAACTAVQTAPATGPAPGRDDRPLYWARLQAIAALRAYGKRNKSKVTLTESDIQQFEWSSRGLEWPKGNISFDLAPAASRKAIVTGFDPFFLPSNPEQSNPSGLVALNFNKQTINQTINSGQSPIYIKTAVFPVRYKDFDEGIAENAVEPNFDSIILLMTCSQTQANFYYVDRFAGRRRGRWANFVDPNPQAGPPLNDNNRALNANVIEPSNVGAGAEYIESTLPYELVITSDKATRLLPAPQSGPPFPRTIPFVLNQSYWVLGAAQAVVRGKRRLDPTNVDDKETYEKQEEPEALAPLFEGSGGNYLSNEIFYRTALRRSKMRPSLASGHLHIPSLGNEPQRLGPGLLNAVETALERFLKSRFRLRSFDNVTFQPTPINTASAPITVTATNDTAETIRVEKVEVTPPFAVQSKETLPFPLPPGGASR